MTATWQESIPLLKNMFNTDWNRANTNQRKPVIDDMTNIEHGRGKRLDLRRQDAI